MTEVDGDKLSNMLFHSDHLRLYIGLDYIGLDYIDFDYI